MARHDQKSPDPTSNEALVIDSQGLARNAT
jgi:hypothetical protein